MNRPALAIAMQFAFIRKPFLKLVTALREAEARLAASEAYAAGVVVRWERMNDIADQAITRLKLVQAAADDLCSYADKMSLSGELKFQVEDATIGMALNARFQRLNHALMGQDLKDYDNQSVPPSVAERLLKPNPDEKVH